MAKAIIDAGICGEETTVTATKKDGYLVELEFESTCPFIQKMAAELTEVDALKEISFQQGLPESIQKGIDHCAHAACPVPIGTVKTIEVEAGLALPKDILIRLES